MKFKLLRKTDVINIDFVGNITEPDTTKEYDIVQGFSVTDNYNETLDSASIKISHTKENIDIEPFDECEIISDTFINNFGKLENDGRYHLYMAVDNYTKRQIAIGSDLYYEYEINLFSQTKFLEGIQLPSLKITSKVSREKRKIYKNENDEYNKWGYLDEYLKEYGQKILVRKPNTEEVYRPKWRYSQRVIDRFSQIECPEMQWNTPTLRQVITDLMMVDDCIPVLRNGVIDYIDLSEKKEPITEYGENNKILLNYVQESQSSTDYVSELKMDVKNALGYGNTTKICEKIGFRNNGVGILNTENIRLETTYPIYNLVSLTMQVWGQGTDGQAQIYFTETRDLVKEGVCVEKSVYDTKDIWYKNFSNSIPIDFAEMSKYQNTCVYFTRGGNSIDGWSRETSDSVIASSHKITYQMLGDAITHVKEAKYSDGSISFLTDFGKLYSTEIEKMFFEVTYETSVDALFSISKEKRTDNARIIVDNQTNSYVNLGNQSYLEYLKANRLGNKVKLINARYEKQDFDKIAKVGDYYQDSIVFQKQVKYFDDYAMVNYYATKDYILRDYFTGVKAKLRSWKYVDGKDALTRHDLIKYYVEISRKSKLPHLDAVGRFGIYEPFAFSFLECFKYDEYPENNDIAVRFNVGDKYLPDKEWGQFYDLELITRKIKNSIVYSFGLNDNIYVGKYINGEVTGGWGQQPFSYTNTNGENLGGEIVFGKIAPMSPADGTWEDCSGANNGTYPTEKSNKMIYASLKKPSIKSDQILNSYKMKIPFNINKDNGEITRLSIQFEVCQNDEDIYVSASNFLDKFDKNNVYYERLYPSNVLQRHLLIPAIYISQTKPSNKYDNIVPEDAIKLAKEQFQINVEKNQITITSELLGNGYVYVGFIPEEATEEYRKMALTFAFKRKSTDAPNQSILYLNVLKNRDKRLYVES